MPAPGRTVFTTDGLHNLYRLFSDLGPFERHVIDVGALTPEQAVDALGPASRSAGFALPSD
jgi:hypothetical protein